MIDAIVILCGVALCNLIALRATGISGIMRVHGFGATREAVPVGWFVIHPKGVLRNLWIFGGLIRVSASLNGLHISSVMPITWKSALVPWDRMRVETNPGATTFGLGFSENPKIEWSMTKAFVAYLQNSIEPTVLKESPFHPLLS